MPDPISTWHEEHVYFRRLLELLHRQVEALPRGGEPNYRLMLDIISYLRDYGDRYHHPREDAAFALIERRCPEMALPLTRLKQEHRVIARAGERLEGLLNAALDGVTVVASDLEAAAATYLVYYGNHIAREEEDVLTRAGESLTAQDWEAVRNAVAPIHDPLFGEHPDERFRNLRRRIAMDS
jgi:hemerythrin-like domain-containing protein